MRVNVINSRICFICVSSAILLGLEIRGLIAIFQWGLSCREHGSLTLRLLRAQLRKEEKYEGEKRCGAVDKTEESGGNPGVLRKWPTDLTATRLSTTMAIYFTQETQSSLARGNREKIRVRRELSPSCDLRKTGWNLHDKREFLRPNIRVIISRN